MAFQARHELDAPGFESADAERGPPKARRGGSVWYPGLRPSALPRAIIFRPAGALGLARCARQCHTRDAWHLLKSWECGVWSFAFDGGRCGGGGLHVEHFAGEGFAVDFVEGGLDFEAEGAAVGAGDGGVDFFDFGGHAGGELFEAEGEVEGADEGAEIGEAVGVPLAGFEVLSEGDEVFSLSPGLATDGFVHLSPVVAFAGRGVRWRRRGERGRRRRGRASASVLTSGRAGLWFGWWLGRLWRGNAQGRGRGRL